MECPSSSSKILSAIPASGGLPPLLHCMPTFLEYAFHEGARASVDIQPVAIMVGIGLALLVLFMDVEAYLAWSDTEKSPSVRGAYSLTKDRPGRE